MGEKFDPDEVITYDELIMANTMKIDALVELMIDKGIITEKEFFHKLRELQHAYQVLNKND